MNKIQKLNKIKKLKESLKREHSKLLKIKERRENPVIGLSKLLETDLDQAKIILAAQDISATVQKMAENMADIGTSDLMPLVDQMRDNFGAQLTEQFEDTVSSAIQECLDKLKDTKDIISDAILVLQGEKEPDIASDTIEDDERIETLTRDADTDDLDLPAEPMGRARRVESYIPRRKKKL